MDDLDENRSLIELDLLSADDLESADDAAPTLTRAANRPLRRLGLVELYLFTKYNLALKAVIPRATARLEDDPMLQAAEYPADLLTTVLESDARYWRDHREQWEQMLPILATAMELAQTTTDEGETTYAIGDTLAAAVLHFMSHHKA